MNSLLYIYFFFLTFAVSIVATVVVRKCARRFAFYDIPGGRKIHTAPIPLMGGIAISFSCMLVVFMHYVFGFLVSQGWCTLDWVSFDYQPLFAGAVRKLRMLLIVFTGGLIILLLGVIDDRHNISVGKKLFYQSLVGVAIYSAGIKISLFIPSEIGSFCLTVFWFLLIVNAFNLLDNMDGLSAGVALISSCMFLVCALQMGQVFISLFLVVFMGSVAGFFVFNYRNATIFMGDAGSMFIGYMLAVCSILQTYYQKGFSSSITVLMPLIVLGIPIYDTMSVVLIRLKQRKPLLSGDTNHFSHRLVRLGMPQFGAVTFIFLINIVIGLNAILLYQVSSIGLIFLGFNTFCLFVIIALLEHLGARNKK